MRLITLSLALATTTLAAPSPRQVRGAASGLFSTPADKTYKTATITDAALGSRTITYWVSDTGEAILPGGIAVGKEADLLATPGDQAHDLTWGVGNKHWPYASVYYRFASDQDEHQVQPLLDQGLAQWRNATGSRYEGGYVHWFRFDNADKDEVNVTKITGQDGCWGTNGWAPGLKPRLNLNPGCGLETAVALLGILQGLQPEHQRPDRETYVHFACENLDPVCHNMPAGKTCCDSGLPQECCGMKSAFDVQHPGSNFFLGPTYDFGSVTHWDADAYALPGKKTLIPVDPGITIPPRPTKPSGQDAFGICALNQYECQHGPHYFPPCHSKRDVQCGPGRK